MKEKKYYWPGPASQPTEQHVRVHLSLPMAHCAWVCSLKAPEKEKGNDNILSELIVHGNSYGILEPPSSCSPHDWVCSLMAPEREKEKYKYSGRINCSW